MVLGLRVVSGTVPPRLGVRVGAEQQGPERDHLDPEKARLLTPSA